MSVVEQHELAVLEPPRYEMQWRWPRLTIYQSSVSRLFRVHLNRHPGVVIGIAPQFGSWVWSVTWGRPGKVRAAGRHRAAA